METPASISKHPIHPMLIVFPIGLWVFSFVCDLISFADPANPDWYVVAFYAIGGGLIGALIAAIAGFIDWLSLKDPKMKSIGLIHMGLNIAIVVLFAINLGVRSTTMVPPPTLAIVLSAIGVGLLIVSGWLGAELVHVHKVSVADEPRATERQTSSPSQVSRRERTA